MTRFAVASGASSMGKRGAMRLIAKGAACKDYCRGVCCTDSLWRAEMTAICYFWKYVRHSLQPGWANRQYLEASPDHAVKIASKG